MIRRSATSRTARPAGHPRRRPMDNPTVRKRHLVRKLAGENVEMWKYESVEVWKCGNGLLALPIACRNDACRKNTRELVCYAAASNLLCGQGGAYLDAARCKLDDAVFKRKLHAISSFPYFHTSIFPHFHTSTFSKALILQGALTFRLKPLPRIARGSRSVSNPSWGSGVLYQIFRADVRGKIQQR